MNYDFDSSGYQADLNKAWAKRVLAAATGSLGLTPEEIIDSVRTSEVIVTITEALELAKEHKAPSSLVQALETWLLLAQQYRSRGLYEETI